MNMIIWSFIFFILAVGHHQNLSANPFIWKNLQHKFLVFLLFFLCFMLENNQWCIKNMRILVLLHLDETSHNHEFLQKSFFLAQTNREIFFLSFYSLSFNSHELFQFVWMLLKSTTKPLELKFWNSMHMIERKVLVFCINSKWFNSKVV